MRRAAMVQTYVLDNLGESPVGERQVLAADDGPVAGSEFVAGYAGVT